MKKLRQRNAMILALLLAFSTFAGQSPLLAQRRPAGAIAYNRVDPETGRGQVWLVNPDGRTDRPVPVSISSIAVAVPVWARDGKSIAVTAALPEDENQALEIFVFEATGANLRRATHWNDSGNSSLPVFKAFSPNGNRLASIAFDQISHRVALAIHRLEGAGGTILEETLSEGEGLSGFGLDWHPRSDLLVIPGATIDERHGSGQPVTALFAMLPASGDVSQGHHWQITFPLGDPSCSCYAADVLPAFSPNGREIAFVRWRFDEDGTVTSSIQVLDLFLSEEREVTVFPGEQVWGVSWSPDGTKLVFDRGLHLESSSGPGFRGLWIINASGAVLRPVNSAAALCPSWNWSR
jgi:Tol biopolymer transport system component